MPSLRVVWPVLLLGVLLWLFEISDVDIFIQDRIYDPVRGAWPITKANEALRLIFYDGPKGLLIAFGVALAAALLWSARSERLAAWRRRLVFMVLVLALTPAIAALGKATTNVYCPLKLERYGGSAPYVRLFDAYPDGYVQAKRGRCFPAGHASGGFALMGLYFVFDNRARRIAGLMVGLGAGWVMGTYQMLIGAHFLSHTVITMVLAWIICVLGERFILKSRTTGTLPTPPVLL